MCGRPGLDVPPYDPPALPEPTHGPDCPPGLHAHVFRVAPDRDPEPDYDGPDPEPDYDAGDVPAGACWCHDAAVCPDVLVDALIADRDPLDAYRDRE